MKTKHLIALLFAALLLGGLAYYQNVQERRSDTLQPTSGQPVFPHLDINRIERVILKDDHSQTTLQRDGDHWGVVERYGYPVDFKRLRNLLTAFNDLTIGRPVQVDPTLKHDLGLLQPARDAIPDNGTGLLIDMHDSRDERLAALTLGIEFHRDIDPHQTDMPFHWRGAEGRYVMTHDNRAMLVSEPFGHIDADPDSWINRRFLNIPAHTLRSIAWHDGKTTAGKLSRDDPGDPWRFDPMPDDRQLDADAIAAFTSFLGGLSFSEIANPDDDPDTLQLTQSPVTLTVRVDDGREYRVTTGEEIPGTDPPRHAMRVAAEFHLPSSGSMKTDDGIPAPVQADQVQRSADSIRILNDRLAPWIYLVDGDTARRLRAPDDTWFTLADPPPNAQ